MSSSRCRATREEVDALIGRVADRAGLYTEDGAVMIASDVEILLDAVEQVLLDVGSLLEAHDNAIEALTSIEDMIDEARMAMR